MRIRFAAFALLCALLSLASVHAAPAPKDWTVLVYLNGHNNLDRFGTEDMNEMEKVGSTAHVNVVVQWASLRNHDTRRVLVQKDSNDTQVTSPAVETLAPVDMGDYRNLVEFVRWGVARYPAKRYFIDVWNHGSGWHLNARGGGIRPSDISFDDITGHHITTEQLGLALKESAAIAGHPIDIYGSDACLMQMAEVAGELHGSTRVVVGSEEVEPGEGWPYDDFLAELNRKPAADAREAGKMLTETYVKSYQGGSQGTREVTFSALDLDAFPRFTSAMGALGAQLRTLDAGDRAKVITAATSALDFTYGDYRDVVDFVSQVERAQVSRLTPDVLRDVRGAVDALVVANLGSSDYSRAHGISVWLPTSQSTFQSYATRYRGLSFNRDSSWGDALQFLTQ